MSLFNEILSSSSSTTTTASLASTTILSKTNELFICLSYDILHEIVSYIINKDDDKMIINLSLVNKHTINYKHHKYYYRLNKYYSLKYYTDENYRNHLINIIHNCNHQISLNLRYFIISIIIVFIILIVIIIKRNKY